jgi:hypothetical protein
MALTERERKEMDLRSSGTELGSEEAMAIASFWKIDTGKTTSRKSNPASSTCESGGGGSLSADGTWCGSGNSSVGSAFSALVNHLVVSNWQTDESPLT